MSKILIVDDYYQNRLYVEGMVTVLGYESEIAVSGNQALEMIKNNRYSLIFMDIEMPGLNGIDTVVELRRLTGNPNRKIPVIGMTGHEADFIRDKTEEAGFDHLILKPYTLEKIDALLKKYLKGT